MDMHEYMMGILSNYHEIQIYAEKVIEQVFQPVGLTRLQGLILLLVYSGNTNSIGDVAKCLGIKQGNCSVVCKKLESVGYLTRERNASDERVVKLALTDKGKQAIEDVKAESARKGCVLEDIEPSKLNRIAEGVLAVKEVLKLMYDTTIASEE
ncbi:MarR family winged helix-turn-helix transcriptional regulator [Anaerosporobacter sp.]|uniref:MarR family winged helix-turn-helix transcriptional regulator n=1 Tax=Anaerosporobacter sp. TaxID=1872529 RepID=UPI00286FA02A|nr:MarR family transcriptional regulator [Anaerosporobacter sp.]